MIPALTKNQGNAPARTAMEDKSKGMIRDIHIRHLHDGSFHMNASTDKGDNFESSHQSPMDLMNAVHDHLTSPHLPKVGSKLAFELKGKK